MTNTSEKTVNNKFTILTVYAPAAFSVGTTLIKFWDMFSAGNTDTHAEVQLAADALGAACIAGLHIASIARLSDAMDRATQHFDNDDHAKASLGFFMIGFLAIVEGFFNFFGLQNFLNTVGVDTFGMFWWIAGGAFAITFYNAFAKFFFLDQAHGQKQTVQSEVLANSNVVEPVQQLEVPRSGNNIHMLWGRLQDEVANEEKPSNKWDDDSINELKTLLLTHTRKDAADKMGVSEDAVNGVCTRHGITKKTLLNAA